MSRTYRAFGLLVRSVIDLDELEDVSDGSDDAEPESAADISVVRGSVDPQPKIQDDGFGFWAGRSVACHRFEGTGSFLVRYGREIVVDAELHATDSLIRASILGPALALALEQRGLFCLHGSAVAIDGRAVGFVGTNGTGKSTLACSLSSLGHPFLTDDVLALKLASGPPRLVPSFARAKLWPDALQQLKQEAGDLPKIHPDLDKRSLSVAERFDSRHVSLDRLYVLGKGASTELVTLTGPQRMELVLANWYCARFGREYIESIQAKNLFASAAQLARHVPARKLLRPPAQSGRMEQVQEIEHAIKQDLASDRHTLVNDETHLRLDSRRIT